MSDKFNNFSPQQIHDKKVQHALTFVCKILMLIAILWILALGYSGAWSFVWIEVVILAVLLPIA